MKNIPFYQLKTFKLVIVTTHYLDSILKRFKMRKSVCLCALQKIQLVSTKKILKLLDTVSNTFKKTLSTVIMLAILSKKIVPTEKENHFLLNGDINQSEPFQRNLYFH